ncbi:hypothetical protein BDR03DRAFT_977629 [Suillus americanus]|nr:hypothetical protein BDR03DRAFT_977629 [Suillus americanus]
MASLLDNPSGSCWCRNPILSRVSSSGCVRGYRNCIELDKEDDEKAGVKFTAIRQGEGIRPALSFLMCCTYLCLPSVGWEHERPEPPTRHGVSYEETRRNDVETAERKKNEDKGVSAA